MSVILFSKEEVYQELADSYEGLKSVMRRAHMPFTQEDDAKFYKALRRLYFANVAAYLCQYHDESPLGPDELAEIDPFLDLQGHADPYLSTAEKVARFIGALDRLTYNLATNDGEMFIAKDSFEHLESLARRYAREFFESQRQK